MGALPSANEVGFAFGCREIMGLLPHRYPFLLLDKVTECVPGSRISGIKNVASGQPDVREFLGELCVSPLMLIESLAQLSVILTFRTLDIVPTGRELLFFAGIDQARFDGGVRVGETVVLSSTISRLMRTKGVGIFATKATVGARTVAEATLMAALQVVDKGAE